MLKKIITSLLAAVIAFTFLTGFSTQKTVPEKTLEWAVEDFLDWHRYIGGNYTDYRYEVTHDPDKSTNTDTVRIDLFITYPHVTASSVYTATYQYDKSSDLWNVLRGGYWGPLDILTYDLTASPHLWMDSIESVGWEGYADDDWEDILDCFLDADAISLPDLEKVFQSGWTIGGGQYYETDRTFERAYMNVNTIELNDTSIAQELFNFLLDDYFDYCKIDESKDGKNYSVASLSYRDRDVYIVIRQDATVFSVETHFDNPYNGSENDFYYILQEIGYVDSLTAG